MLTVIAALTMDVPKTVPFHEIGNPFHTAHLLCQTRQFFVLDPCEEKEKKEEEKEKKKRGKKGGGGGEGASLPLAK